MIVAPDQLEEHRAAGAEANRCFGLGPLGLHDRYWASRRVRVVRRGLHQQIEPGPSLFLLIEPADLVLLDPRPVARRLRAGRASLARLRLHAASNSRSFRERVELDGRGAFASVRRAYDARARASTRAWLTPDSSLARAWTLSNTRAAGTEALAMLVPKKSVVSMSIDASVYRAENAAGEDSLRELMGVWSRVGSVLPGVYELRPGVWVHESARIDPTARLIPPVWAGAGTAIPPGRLVVGPAAVADASPIDPPAESDVDWKAMKAPAWRLKRPMGRRAVRHVTKRLFDIGFSLAVLGVTLPLYPIIILAIALEDGWPPFFAHTRQTRRGKPFPCLKFRTMCKDAERIKREIMAKNEVDGPQFFVKDDPRVLKVGAFLRRYQIDEFPQFINVLLGQMSVVGPRPSPDNENQYCPTWREMRLAVRPGVTGLWQVKRTREQETDFQEWIRYDLEYVQHHSWRMDIWIIIQTIKRVIGG